MSDLRRTTATYPVRSNVNTIEWMYDRTDYGSNEGLTMEVAMNAMPAVTPPYDSGIRPRHGGAAHPGRHPRRDHSLEDAPRAALRLTRRGRVVAATVAALLVTVISLLAAWRGPGDEPRPAAGRGSAEPRQGGRPPGPEPVVGGRERGPGPGHPRRHPADRRPQLAERRRRVRRPAALGTARLSPGTLPEQGRDTQARPP